MQVPYSLYLRCLMKNLLAPSSQILLILLFLSFFFKFLQFMSVMMKAVICFLRNYDFKLGLNNR